MRYSTVNKMSVDQNEYGLHDGLNNPSMFPESANIYFFLDRNEWKPNNSWNGRHNAFTFLKHSTMTGKMVCLDVKYGVCNYGAKTRITTDAVLSHHIGIGSYLPLCDQYKLCALSCLFNMSKTLHICLVSCTSKPKRLSPNLSCSVWNTAIQIGTQLGVKVNGSDLQNRDLQLPHMLWQPWHRNVQLFKEEERENVLFSHSTVLAV